MFFNRQQHQTDAVHSEVLTTEIQDACAHQTRLQL